MKQKERIIIDPKIMVGKPIIKGTRVTVELILRHIAQGIAVDEIIKNYPHITKEDIYAAVEYAADLVEDEVIHQIPIHGYAEAQALA